MAISDLYKDETQEDCRQSVKFILQKNIIHGNALTLQTLGDKPKPIIFAEWSPVNGSMIKRRDFAFKGLLAHAAVAEMPLFSDLGEDVFIPEPVKDYPLMHFLRIADAQYELTAEEIEFIELMVRPMELGN